MKKQTNKQTKAIFVLDETWDLFRSSEPNVSVVAGEGGKGNSISIWERGLVSGIKVKWCCYFQFHQRYLRYFVKKFS